MIILTHNGVEESECSTKSKERTVLLISKRLPFCQNCLMSLVVNIKKKKPKKKPHSILMSSKQPFDFNKKKITF